MASCIKGFNWLTYCGGKFSTSQKRGVFMDQALDIFPADYWRYFLIAMAPEADDSDFKSNREEAAMVLRTCINLARAFAIASSPIIPCPDRARARSRV